MSKLLDQAPMFIKTGKQAKKFLGIPLSTQYRMLADGELPPTIRINKKCQGWHIDTLNDFFKGITGKSKGGAS